MIICFRTVKLIAILIIRNKVYQSQAERSHEIASNRRRHRRTEGRSKTESTPTTTPTSPLIARLRERLANKTNSNASNSPTLNMPVGSKKSNGIESPMSESASSQLGFGDPNKTPDSFCSAKKNLNNYSGENDGTRKPRSKANITNAQTRRYRSASAGANINRKIREMKSIVEAERQVDPILSPRTQLKNAREGLKKVPNKRTVSNNTFQVTPTSYTKFKETNTFTDIPKSPENEKNTKLVSYLASKPPLQPKHSIPNAKSSESNSVWKKGQLTNSKANGKEIETKSVKVSNGKHKRKRLND